MHRSFKEREVAIFATSLLLNLSGAVSYSSAAVCIEDEDGCRRTISVAATSEANTVIFGDAKNGSTYEITAAGIWAQDPDPQFNTGPDGLATFGTVFSGPFTGILFGAFAVLEPGSSTWIHLGSSGSVTATADGPILGSFADLPGLYGDNTGLVRVTVVETPCDEPEPDPAGSPLAVAAVSQGLVCAPVTLGLDGSLSTDGEGSAEGVCWYNWTLKNRSNSQQRVVVLEGAAAVQSIALFEPGDYEIVLTVTDSQGNTATAAAAAIVARILFDPPSIEVTAGAISEVVVTITPASLAGSVEMSIEQADIAEVSPLSPSSAQEPLTVTGLATGTTVLSGLISVEDGSLVCGTAEVQVSAGPDDECPDDPNKNEPGVCGCGTPDVDGDGNGVVDCLEPVPTPPVAGASTPTPVVLAGQMATLDGSGSDDTDDAGVGPRIASYDWTLQDTSDSAAPPIAVSSTDPVTTVMLPLPAVYEAVLTVRDNDGQASPPADTLITAVQVSLSPDSISVSTGESGSIAVQTRPGSAIGLVSFGLTVDGVATLDKGAPTSADDSLTVAGTAAGSTGIQALVATSQGNQTADETSVQVTDGPEVTARFNPDPLRLCWLRGNLAFTGSTHSVTVSVTPPDTPVTIEVGRGTDVIAILPGPTQEGQGTFTVQVASRAPGSAELVAKVGQKVVGRGEVEVRAVEVRLRGRQIICLNNPEPTIATIGAMAIEIVTEGAYFVDPKAADWSVGLGGLLLDFGTATDRLPPDAEGTVTNLGAFLQGQSQGTKPVVQGISVQGILPQVFDVGVTFRITADGPGAGGICLGSYETGFVAIQVRVTPSMLPDGNKPFLVGDPPQKLTMTVTPAGNYPGAESAKPKWARRPVNAETFEFVEGNATDGLTEVHVRPLRVTADPANPQGAEAQMFITGTNLAGDSLLINCIRLAPIVVGGCELVLADDLSKTVICAGEETKLTFRVRPHNGAATIAPAEMVKQGRIQVDGTSFEVLTKRLNLATQGVRIEGNTGIATINVAYAPPGAGEGAGCNTAVDVRIKPADGIQLLGAPNAVCVCDKQLKLEAKLLCGNQDLSDARPPPRPIWDLIGNIPDGTSIDARTGVLTIGGTAGPLTVRVAFSRQDNPEYLIPDIVTTQQITLVPPVVRIVNPPGAAATAPVQLHATVACNNQIMPNPRVKWVVNGVPRGGQVVIKDAGEYDIKAVYECKGQEYTDSKRIVVREIHHWQASRSMYTVNVSLIPTRDLFLFGGIIWFREVRDDRPAQERPLYFVGIAGDVELPDGEDLTTFFIDEVIEKFLDEAGQAALQGLLDLIGRLAQFVLSVMDLAPTEFVTVQGADSVNGYEEFLGTWGIQDLKTMEHNEKGYVVTFPADATFGESGESVGFVDLKSKRSFQQEINGVISALKEFIRDLRN